MARIRTVKPEYFKHEDLQDLEREHPGQYVMLVYEALWCHSDNQGVFSYSPRMLKTDILPFLDYDIAETLRLLEQAGMIRRFEYDGKVYGHILTFNKHQRLSGKEAGDDGKKYPAPQTYIQKEDTGREATGKQEGSNREATGKQEGSNREALGKQQGSIGEATGKQEGSTQLPRKGKERKGKERNGVDANRVQKKEIVPVDLSTYHTLVGLFERDEGTKALLYSQGDSTTARELKAAKDVAARIEKLYPAQPDAFALEVVRTFWRLIRDGLKATFMPSQLNIQWVWYRVIKELQDASTTQQDSQRLEDIVEGRAETNAPY